MLRVIEKKHYWDWLDQGFSKPTGSSLKGIQDTCILSMLSKVEGARILEVGAGNSRIIEKLGQNNEVWVADKFDGRHGGPGTVPNLSGARVAQCYLGEFSDELPNNYFDFVFSISVVEHIPSGSLTASFKDMARVCKTGGTIIHAIDLYLLDEGAETPIRQKYKSIIDDRINQYMQLADALGGSVAWLEEPAVNMQLAASARFAENGIDVLYGWNSFAPTIKDLREQALSVSLQLALVRT